MISINQLSKIFPDRKRGAFTAVQPVSFDVQAGEIFGLLGPNGAGKTTLLRMLATILTPSSGTAKVNGYDLREYPNEIKKSIGFLSGNTKLYGRLSPRELLYYFGELYDMNLNAIHDRTDHVLRLLHMEDFADRRIEKLSTGQMQKTSIARCILHDPPVFIFDEPTLGLDILTSRTIVEFIRESANAGKTIIFSTHYMQEAERLCDRIGLLHQGELLDIDSLNGYREKTHLPHLDDIFLSYIEAELN
ncbi:ATP-binding cassette domain-containing protein [candidate division KSB1 bacterium]|nr:ATP-binding cassette domain-containing protein [candidate division KSB1 bacterium]